MVESRCCVVQPGQDLGAAVRVATDDQDPVAPSSQTEGHGTADAAGVAGDHPGLRGVHVVVAGECEVSVDDRPPLRLRAGDLVLFPRGDAHVLQSPGAGRGPAQSGVALAMAAAAGDEVRGGGPGTETVVLCGAFLVTRHDHPALAGLPRVVHVAADSAGQRWLAPYVDALTSEVRTGGPGSAVVTARLSDALVARALRFQVEVTDEPGLLLGLADPFVAAGLAAMHDDLARPWTVASLAAAAGLSRAAFAARFRARMGTTPAGYLVRLRMARASILLRDERAWISRSGRSEQACWVPVSRQGPLAGLALVAAIVLGGQPPGPDRAGADRSRDRCLEGRGRRAACARSTPCSGPARWTPCCWPW